VLQRDRPSADFIVVYWTSLVDFSSDDFIIYLVGLESDSLLVSSSSWN
jgi:hypothetical protein